VLAANLSPEDQKLQKQRLQLLRKHIKDAELDLFLAGDGLKFDSTAMSHIYT
jgi:hypothetical protein